MEKTMTQAQMSWSLRNGFAWEDLDNGHEDEFDSGFGLSDVFYTKEHTWGWDPNRQVYMTF